MTLREGTATEAMERLAKADSRKHMFMHALEQWIRRNVEAVPLERCDMPEHDLVMTVPIGGSEIPELIKEHLPTLLQFLPEHAVVVDRRILNKFMAAIPIESMGISFMASPDYSDVLERYGAELVNAQAYATRVIRRDREQEARYSSLTEASE